MITDKNEIALCLHEVLCDAYEKNLIPHNHRGTVSVGMLYPFSQEDVDIVYTYKSGEGDGLWFQLNNGEIWNSKGECEGTEDNFLYR